MVDTKQAAELLITARRKNQRIHLPPTAVPATLDEAYAVQDQLRQDIGIPQVGWKVALTNEPLQQLAHVSEPIAGPLFESLVGPTPQTITDSSATLYGFEFEFAFRMGKDLPPQGAPYSVAAVTAAADTLHPAIEPVGSRLVNGPAQGGAPGLIADHGGNYSFVYAPAVPNWQQLDLSTCIVRALFDGQLAATKTGANVVGNPLNSLTWLANHLAQRGLMIKAGDWVTTGAAIGPLSTDLGVTVTADFGNLGIVEIHFQS
ncbi:MAG: 2-keto-4-pentenoate hydratase [Leptolyngbyaceae cyanobacterium]